MVNLDEELGLLDAYRSRCFIFHYYSPIEIMKSYQFRMTHPAPLFPKQHIVDLFDHKLQYLNRSFSTNLRFHELYIDLIKHKKSLRAQDIHQLYLTFTLNKADALMFDHEIEHKKDEFEQIEENVNTLKRIYARLIQKIIVKISYYLSNKQRLHFISKNISDIAKKCQILTRRFHNVKDFSYINELINNVYHQNEVIQEKILSQLVNKGYVSSVDQFYRINGVDLQCQEYYQCRQNDPRKQTKEFKSIKLINHLAQGSNKKIKSSKMIFTRKELLKSKPFLQPDLQIQNKYRKIISQLSEIFSDEQKTKKDKLEENQKARRQLKDRIMQTHLFKTEISEAKQEIGNSDILYSEDEKMDNEGQRAINCDGQSDDGHIHPPPQTIEKPSFSSPKVFSNKRLRHSPSKEYKETTSVQFQTKNELKFQEVNVQNFFRNSQIGRSSGQSSKRSYFSKEFVAAIQTIQKSNFTEPTNKLSVKLMSEHMMKFKKQIEPVEGKKIQAKIGLGKHKGDKHDSILNLLNIYKKNRSRELIKKFESIQEERSGQMQKRGRGDVGIEERDADIWPQKNNKQGKSAVGNNRTEQFTYEQSKKYNTYGQFLREPKLTNQQAGESKDSTYHHYQQFVLTQTPCPSISRKQEPFVHTHRNAFQKIEQQRLVNLTPSSYPQLYYCNKEVVLGGRQEKSRVTFRNKIIKEHLGNVCVISAKLEMDSMGKHCRQICLNQQQAKENSFIMTHNGVEMARTGHSPTASISRQKRNTNQHHPVSPLSTPLHFQIYDRIRRIKI